MVARKYWFSLVIILGFINFDCRCYGCSQIVVNSWMVNVRNCWDQGLSPFCKFVVIWLESFGYLLEISRAESAEIKVKLKILENILEIFGKFWRRMPPKVLFCALFVMNSKNRMRCIKYLLLVFWKHVKKVTENGIKW